MQRFPSSSVIITQQPQQPYPKRTSRLTSLQPSLQPNLKTSNSNSNLNIINLTRCNVDRTTPTGCHHSGATFYKVRQACPLNNQCGHQCSQETQPPAVITQIVRRDRCFLCTAPNTVPAGHRFGNIIRPWKVNQVN